MENITYVTGNYGKYISVKEKFEKAGIEINYYKYDLEEPNINDIEFISKEKAKRAYQLLKSPVFVVDSGFYIDNYPGFSGYPGAFVKRSGISSNIEELLNKMKNINDRHCQFVDCLTFFDGTNYYTFYGISEGSLAYSKQGTFNKKAKSNLWYIFIPNNCTKTLAEMTDEERNNRKDNRRSATDEFIKWYQKTYIKNKRRTYGKNYNRK